MDLRQAVQREIRRVKRTKVVPQEDPARDLAQRDKLKTDHGGHGQKFPSTGDVYSMPENPWLDVSVCADSYSNIFTFLDVSLYFLME